MQLTFYLTSKLYTTFAKESPLHDILTEMIHVLKKFCNVYFSIMKSNRISFRGLCSKSVLRDFRDCDLRDRFLSNRSLFGLRLMRCHSNGSASVQTSEVN